MNQVFFQVKIEPIQVNLEGLNINLQNPITGETLLMSLLSRWRKTPPSKSQDAARRMKETIEALLRHPDIDLSAPNFRNVSIIIGKNVKTDFINEEGTKKFARDTG